MPEAQQLTTTLPDRLSKLTLLHHATEIQNDNSLTVTTHRKFISFNTQFYTTYKKYTPLFVKFILKLSM